MAAVDAWAPSHSYSPEEFEREARRIDALTFETLALSAGEAVVFCGFTAGGAYARRAKEIGCKVAVIEAREHVIREYADLGVRVIRGSTSVIPARDGAFDVAVAAGYLHEVDPSFHSHIVSELGRVARRVGIIELAPPTDPLGRRIAALYSRAKQELGSFEHYQPLEYWKKLVTMVKADISQSIFQFGKLPPIEYLIDTVDLLLDTIEAEEAPEEDLEELRSIARRSNAMLLPQARLVLIGAATGQIPHPTYSEVATGLTETVATLRAPAREIEQPLPVAQEPAPAPPPAQFVPAAAAAAPPQAIPAPIVAEPVLPAVPPAGAANPFGLPDVEAVPLQSPPRFGPVTTGPADHPPFGAPFPVPPAPDQAPFTPAAGPTGWTWEPPEDDLA
jgi:hypothetical protein